MHVPLQAVPHVKLCGGERCIGRCVPEDSELLNRLAEKRVFRFQEQTQLQKESQGALSCDILHSSPSLSIPCSKVVEGAVGDTPDGAGTDTACSRIAARLWIVEQVSHLARASVKWSSAGSGALQLRTADSGIARAGQQQAQRAPSHGSKGTTSTLTWSTIAVHRWGEGGAFWTPREVLAQPRTHISSAASKLPHHHVL